MNLYFSELKGIGKHETIYHCVFTGFFANAETIAFYDGIETTKALRYVNGCMKNGTIKKVGTIGRLAEYINKEGLTV